MSHILQGRQETGHDYLQEIEFDRPNHRIVATYGKERRELEFEKDIIDGLTVKLQMMLDLQRGIEQPKYRIVDFNRLKEYEFSHEGVETISIEGVDH